MISPERIDRAFLWFAALATLLALGAVAVAALRTPQREWRTAGALLFGALLLLLGSALPMVVYGVLPLLAVAHSAAAAVLLLAGTTLLSSLNGYGRVRC